MGSHTIPSEAPTKEFSKTVFFATDMMNVGGKIDAVDEYAAIMMIIPQDFSSITSIEVIFGVIGSGASMHFDMWTFYGAYDGGEAASTHTESEVARDIGATVDGENLAHDISDLVDVAALAAGDLLRVLVGFNATAIDSRAYVKELRLKYT